MKIEDLLNKTITYINNDDKNLLIQADGNYYKMFHENDCCEWVYLEDIVGDLSDLVDSPLLQAEESSNNDNPKDNDESHTWTFYKLATIKGSVILRWYGTSSGYYSEGVDIVQISDDEAIILKGSFKSVDFNRQLAGLISE